MKESDAEKDEKILRAIQSYQGVPNASNLCKANGGPLEYGHNFIGERLRCNPSLQDAMESKGVSFVEACDRETFAASISAGKWKKRKGKVGEAIDRRLDNRILEAIQLYQGIPHASSISKENGGPLEYGVTILEGRLKANPSLQDAMESKGVSFVEACDRETFDSSVTTKKWVNATGKTREAIDQRIDSTILEAIQSFPGFPNANNLSKRKGGPLEYGYHTISKRLDANPELRAALLKKRGLTEDQINALDAEREAPAPALVESIRRRLPNTRIFREAVCLLKQFAGMFTGKVLESSFYPQPLSMAARFLGRKVKAEYFRAHELKDPGFGIEETGFDTVALLQCCHRISDDALAKAFNEANYALRVCGNLLISLPEDFQMTGRFPAQAQEFGFELQAEGTLFARSLPLQELRIMQITDAERVKQKIEQETNVIVLVKTRPAAGKSIDGFIAPMVAPMEADGNGEFRPAMGEINAPPELLASLSSAFRQRKGGIDDGFILTVLDDATYKEKEVIGFDVNPAQRRLTEVYSPDDNSMDLAELTKLARRLAKAEFRERLLIKAGMETKMPARMVRSIK